MSKPYRHAVSSARRWGGEPEDYLEFHDFMDHSKSVIADNRHRLLTHHAWFLFVAERVLGHNITSSAGRAVSVRDLGEQHLLEDFSGKYIPTAADYLVSLERADWMAVEHDSAAEHAARSASRFGGRPEDYLDLHELLNSAAAAFSDERWRALTHHTWFAKLCERIYGEHMPTADGAAPTFQVACDHIEADFGRLLSAHDFCQIMDFAEWMNNAQRQAPPSAAGIRRHRTTGKTATKTIIRFDLD